MNIKVMLNDVRLRSYVVQAGLLTAVALLIGTLLSFTSANLRAKGIPLGFDFLFRPAGFSISETILPYKPTDPNWWAAVVGVANSLFISAIVLVASSILGLFVGIGRLSSNPLASGTCRVWVEIARNTPALILLIPVFAYGQILEPLESESTDIEQSEDEIETDRDSFTPATSVVGRRRVVIESAYSFIDNRHVPETHSLPELVARYGISERIELRLGCNYEVGGAGNPTSGNVPNDLEDEPHLEYGSHLLYGTKIWLSQQDNWIPQSSVMLQGFTPTSGMNTDTHFSATYVYGWKLPNNWVWDSSMRYSMGSLKDDRFNIWAPSTVLKIPIGERWKAHAEYFGVLSDGRATESVQHFFSPGVHYLINSDWEIGVRVGWGLNEQAPNFFSNVGCGYRF